MVDQKLLKKRIRIWLFLRSFLGGPILILGVGITGAGSVILFNNSPTTMWFLVHIYLLSILIYFFITPFACRSASAQTIQITYTFLIIAILDIASVIYFFSPLNSSNILPYALQFTCPVIFTITSITYGIHLIYRLDLKTLRKGFEHAGIVDERLGLYYMNMPANGKKVHFRKKKPNELATKLLDKFSGPISWLLYLLLLFGGPLPIVLYGVDNNIPVSIMAVLAASFLGILCLVASIQFLGEFIVLRQVEKEIGKALKPTVSI